MEKSKETTVTLIMPLAEYAAIVDLIVTMHDGIFSGAGDPNDDDRFQRRIRIIKSRHSSALASMIKVTDSQSVRDRFSETVKYDPQKS